PLETSPCTSFLEPFHFSSSLASSGDRLSPVGRFMPSTRGRGARRGSICDPRFEGKRHVSKSRSFSFRFRQYAPYAQAHDEYLELLYSGFLGGVASSRPLRDLRSSESGHWRGVGFRSCAQPGHATYGGDCLCRAFFAVSACGRGV